MPQPYRPHRLSRQSSIGRRLRAAVVTVTITAGIMAAVSPVDAGATPETCSAGWESTTLATGLGVLENLEPDGEDGFYVTGIQNGVLYHVDAAGHVETVLTNLDHPAGVRLVGHFLYFLTNNAVRPGPPTGTLQRLDTATGATTTLLTGLNAPNGLLLLPDGDLLISDLPYFSPPGGISRFRPATGQFTPVWSAVAQPNGLALTPDRSAVYTENTFASQIVRIPLDAPDAPTVVARIPGLVAGTDDMESTAAGTLFVAGNVSAAIHQVDPDTGASCASYTGSGGIPPNGPTSVRIAPDGKGWALYVTGFDGALRRLRPPPGIDLTPAYQDTPRR
ncbi:SMP-30/gluconolactonase/LRE family protein [Nocardia sp. NPDC046473]|uniref:SMP-30/gluconolactonase/LRE family protein n=1 Tax=Nocardia sp. NPDC046473 TaxID=3155733 RepID=UPI0033D950EF